MQLYGTCTLLLIAGLMTGCVSLSEYHEKVAEVGTLKGNVATLEEKLQASEAAGKALDTDLQKQKDALAKLQEQHETLKTESVAMTAGSAGEQSAMGAKKQAFATDIDSVSARLAEADARIKELSASLTTQEAAVAERDQRIKALTESLRASEARIEQLQAEVAELSKKRAVSDEKERAVAEVRAALGGEIDNGELTVTEQRDKMIVALPEKVLFVSGSATITRSGKKVLDRMAQILKKVKNNQLRIEGHTDSATIGPKIAGKFPTNWDLAAARATSVVKYLEVSGKVDPKLLALAGYGPNQPVAANDTAKGRTQNRRIEIALLPFEPIRPASPAAKAQTK